MADDRPINDPVQELAELRRVVEDMRTTLMTRTQRRPTGTVEGMLLAAAPAGTLLLDGTTKTRAAYPALWSWIVENGLNGGAPFGNGDGSTTFTLPDWRGRVPRGVASGGTPGQLVGADSITLSTAQLPSHSHSISSSGSHGGHQNFPITVQAGSGATDVMCGPAVSAGSHDHGGGTGNTGSGSSVDVRQASFALRFVIYT